MELEMDPPQLNNYSKTTGTSHAPRETIGESIVQRVLSHISERLRLILFCSHKCQRNSQMVS